MAYSDGARGWLLWPGVALMVAEALTSLVMSWPTFMRALKLPKSLDSDASSGGQHIPNSWWIGGLTAGGTLTAVIASMVFDIPVLDDHHRDYLVGCFINRRSSLRG